MVMIIAGILILCLVICPDLVAAQQTGILAETTTITPSMTTNVIHFFHIVIAICSWVWIILASLAGKMLTNTVVYGEFINLDAALYQLWNITRTFANYALGFLILYKILRYIFSDPTQTSPTEIFKSIGGVVLGGIGVQFSRFLMGALIDIATILTVAMGSLPTLIITNDGPMQQYLAQQTIKIPKKMTINLDNPLDQPLSDFVFPSDGQDAATGSEMQELGMTEFVDRLIPNAANAGGPLLYIGLSVIHAQNYLARTPNMTKNDVTDAIVTIVLKAGLLILYTVALFLLVVINVMRTLYIWLLIAISPFLVLYAGMSMMGTSIGEDFKKYLDRGEVLKAIFMPVVFVSYLGLMLVMIVTMQRMMVSNEGYAFNNGSVFVEGNRVGFAGSSFTLDGELWPNAGEDIKTTITDLLLMIFSLLLMYGLVFLATSRGPKFIVDIASKVRTLAMSVLGNIPVGGGMTARSVLSFPAQLMNEQRKFTSNKISQLRDEGGDVMREALGKLGIKLDTPVSNTSLTTSIQKIESVKDDVGWNTVLPTYLKDANIPAGTSLGDSRVKKLFDAIVQNATFINYLKNEFAKISYLKGFNFDEVKDKKTMEEFVSSITNPANKKNFIQRLSSKLNLNNPATIDSWNKFLAYKIPEKTI